MIPELGHFALILACVLALVQAVVPLVASFRQFTPGMQLARYTALGQWIFTGMAFSSLAYCFLTNDFSLAYVAENSNTHLPAIYRFCAIWGAHEGSLLLWVFILTTWNFAVSRWSSQLPEEMLARVLAVMAMIAVGFDLFLLFTSNPFMRLLPNIPLDGNDLNPILQDPGLVSHPPMLYMGYVGFSVAFAFAIAALMGGRLDALWARWSRPWTLLAWTFLTLGIVLGSWWAYRELGWGGWWFWDPVENASFLPWLAGTALIHSLIVAEKRNVFKAWTVLLAICTFSLSLLGTFLVRSGVLISVHAFAVDPQRGLYLLRFLAVVVGASLTLYAWRGKTIVNTGQFQLFSRETFLLSNNVILFTAMITVLLGTLYPLIMSTFHLGTLSVGAAYFNAVFVPLMLPLLFLLGIGPLLHWQQTVFSRLRNQLILTAIFCPALVTFLLWITHLSWHFSVFIALCLAAWVLINNFSLFRLRRTQQWAMLCAHVGVAIVVIGIAMTSFYSEQKEVSMVPFETTSIGPYQFTFLGVSPIQGPNYTGYEATMVLSKNNHPFTVLHPQLRDFTVEQIAAGKTAIDASIFRDLYVALGNPLNGQAWSVRLYYKPFVRWIWYGGLFMVLGGILAFTDRRYRR